jgi:serine/threonine-protein kinase
MRRRAFGRYWLLDEIGAGGMAVVSRALIEGPLGFSRALCIKRIRPALSREPWFIHSLASEARLSALLFHPNIVQVHDFGDVDGEYYIAMELVEGLDLLGVLRCASHGGVPLPVGVVCYLVAEVARALGYAHTLTDGDGRPRGIIHRDVTPSNIMITPLGAVKLLDFGIARAAAHIRDHETRSGALHGKVNYLSPEQVNGRPATPQSDLFSLGVVFHELLTLRRLFAGKNDLQVLQAVCAGEVPAPSSLRPDVPRAVDGVLLRLLDRDPARRFASGEELACALLPLARCYRGDAFTLQELFVRLQAAPPSVTELESCPTRLSLTER